VSRAASLARVTAAYVVALAAGWAWLAAGPSTDHLWLDTLVADLLATLVIFGASRLWRNSSLYDAYWSVVPPAILLYWWVEAGTDGLRVWLVALVVAAWAIRLTGHWANGWPGVHHEDWRYVDLKQGAGRLEPVIDLMAIHVFPTLQVFLAMTPVYVVTVRPDRDTGWLDVVACVVGLGAVLLEHVADRQMIAFVRDRQPGQVMDRGLWGWSRHPNYVGEVGFWFSLALFGLAARPDEWWWIFVGTITMLAMFLLASIPMMEKRSLERRPDYARVVDRVPVFLPWRPRTKAP
jgi:steroid 5-alpha reductase family enzyme